MACDVSPVAMFLILETPPETDDAAEAKSGLDGMGWSPVGVEYRAAYAAYKI